MSLKSKLLDPKQSVLLYGTTPPRSGSSGERIATAAAKLADRIKHLPLDGVVVYDVQDESSRTSAPRPFPFLPTIDPRVYSKRLHGLTGKTMINYKCIAQMSEAEWDKWLTQAGGMYGVRYLSLVGMPASKGTPSPLSLSRAIQVAAAHQGGFTLGGVAIAERHGGGRSESQRMLQKAEDGCSFFISQAVYDPEATIRMLTDYHHDCRQQGVAPKRVILTFTPCGRPKTMEFMKWLGIAISEGTEKAILSDPAPLTRCLQICCSNLRRILSQDYRASLPLGLNIESVSIHKEEIDASVDLFHALTGVLHEQNQRAH